MFHCASMMKSSDIRGASLVHPLPSRRGATPPISIMRRVRHGAAWPSLPLACRTQASSVSSAICRYVVHFPPGPGVGSHRARVALGRGEGAFAPRPLAGDGDEAPGGVGHDEVGQPSATKARRDNHNTDTPKA